MIRRTVAVTGASVVALAGLAFTGPAQATSYNWGNPPDVCDQVSSQAYSNAYANGYCAPAISPQQTVKGTTNLQYLVSCVDAPSSSQGSAGPYFQSLGYLIAPDPANGTTVSPYAQVVAWASSSSVVSGESTTFGTNFTTASNGTMQGSAVTSWGTTPVKVYNGEVAWDSTTVTFAAGCLNPAGVNAWDGIVTSGASADTIENRILSLRAAVAAGVARSQRDFATGERKRAEYQVRARTLTGVEVHDRINLKAGKAERTTLLCPRGLVPSGDPQTSYGFDALKDVSGYEPRITAKRAWSKRGVTLSYSAGKLKYPTVAYTVLPCAKPTR